MLRAPWEDLLNRPHAEMNCYNLVREYFRRAGVFVPEIEIAKASPESTPAMFQFRVVSSAPEEGDIVETWDKTPGIVEHLGVVVSDRRMLHSSAARGRVHLTPLRVVERNIIRILRYAPIRHE